jgi:hypothetical protein
MLLEIRFVFKLLELSLQVFFVSMLCFQAYIVSMVRFMGISSECSFICFD